MKFTIITCIIVYHLKTMESVQYVLKILIMKIHVEVCLVDMYFIMNVYPNGLNRKQIQKIHILDAIKA